MFAHRPRFVWVLFVCLCATAPGFSQWSSAERESLVEARTLLREGEIDAALECLEELRSQVGDETEVLALLGAALESAGRNDEAVATFRRVLANEPKNRGALEALERLDSGQWEEGVVARAERLLGAGRFKEASYLFRRLREEHPDDPKVLLGLARCAEGLGERTEASELYGEVLARDPNSSLARERLDALKPASEASPASRHDPPSTRGEEPRPAAEDAPKPQEAQTEKPGKGRREESEEVTTTEPARNPPAQGRDETAVLPAAETVERTLVPPTTTTAAEEEAAQPSPAPLEAPGQEANERGSMPSLMRSTEGDPESRQNDSTEVEGATRSSTVVVIALAVSGVALLWGLALWVSRRRRCTVKGSLEQHSLPDLIQVLGQGQWEGVLNIHAGHEHHRIFLRGEEMVRAESGDTGGEEALHRILSLRHGRFVFCEQTVPSDVECYLEISVPQALLRWACRTDHENRDAALAGSFLEGVEDSELNIDLPM